MPGMEAIVRPFVGQDVTPTREFVPGGASAPPVRLAIGLIGGNKTFSFTGSSSLSSYMATVNTEKTSTAFDMTTGELAS
jgi:hypothetical protein